MVAGKVDGQILFGARSEKPKIYLVPGVRNQKFYLVPNDSYKKIYLAVKGLNIFNVGSNVQEAQNKTQNK